MEDRTIYSIILVKVGYESGALQDDPSGKLILSYGWIRAVSDVPVTNLTRKQSKIS
jgi:hypothetical protein